MSQQLTFIKLASGDFIPSSAILRILPGYARIRLADGDFDVDGDTDQVDFGLFQSCLGQTSVVPAGAPCSGRDLNRDGQVNRTDLTLFRKCLSGPGVPPNPDCAK